MTRKVCAASEARAMMRSLIAIVLILAAPTPVFAWGQTGHRVTGAIAEPLLTRKAAREVRAIIGT